MVHPVSSSQSARHSSDSSSSEHVIVSYRMLGSPRTILEAFSSIGASAKMGSFACTAGTRGWAAARSAGRGASPPATRAPHGAPSRSRSAEVARLAVGIPPDAARCQWPLDEEIGPIPG
jgi:hypothetical protein